MSTDAQDSDPEDDLRIKAILDDGTGTVTAILGREMTEEIYGGDLEDAKDAAREAMDQSVVAEAIADELVGRTFSVRGHLSVDEYGANLEVTGFDDPEESPVERANAFLAETEVRA